VLSVRESGERAGSLISSQPSSGFTRIVSFPHALSFSPAAVRNSRADSHWPRHCAWVNPAAARLPRLRSSALPPRTTGTAPASSCRSTRASRALSNCRRMALACRSAGVAYPRTRPSQPPAGTASRASIRPTRACRLVLSARRFRSARLHWSSLVRVIAPAHRDDDSAVSARFRAARDTARPFASSRPSAHRAARSRPASDPRCNPAARSTASSAGETRSRVRTLAPAGAAATNGAAISRSPLTRQHHLR
jgi:hypothetical protein